MKNSLFISYSRADMAEVDWIGRLRMYLAPLRRTQSVEVWDDSKIPLGTDWRKAIDDALQRAKTAVLLVGPGFLASDFVMEYELPRLLADAQDAGTRIFTLVVGYCGYQFTELERYQAFNEPTKPLESLSRSEQNKVLNELCISVAEALGEAQASVVLTEPNMRFRLREAAREIATNLQDTRTAYVAQCRRRDALVEDIERRLGIRSELEYEKFFFQCFPGLTGPEKFEFDQIRGITEGQLQRGNRRIVEILAELPELLDEIPTLTELRQHLVFWLNKFDRVFSQNKAMCVLYTGVEDRVPFPPHVADAVEKWLAKQ